MHRQCLDGPINSYHSFLWSNLILCIHNVDILYICMKEFGLGKNIIDKMIAMRIWTIFQDCFTKGLCLFYQCIHGPNNSYHSLNICMKEFGTQKYIIDKMAAMRTLTFFRLVSTKRGECLFYDSAYTGQSTPTTAFDGAI